MMRALRGTNRLVILVGGLALKIPAATKDSFKGRLHSFLSGWKQNLTECAYSKTGDIWLCPIYFSVFGLVNVMPECNANTLSEKFHLEMVERLKRESPNWYMVEPKRSSFGILSGKNNLPARYVAIDYGNDCIALQQDKLRRSL